jgi:hypothetical protein
MSAVRHQPPSRLRYAAAHPTIGVHVDSSDYERLLALRKRAGVSFAQLVLRALGEVELQVDAAVKVGQSAGYRAGKTAGRQEGYKAGFAAAAKKYQLVAHCARCGKGIVIEARSQLGEVAVGLLNAEVPHHDTCVARWTLTQQRPTA